MSSLLKSREAALALIIVVMIGLVGLRAPVFLTLDSLNGVLTDTALLAMMALHAIQMRGRLLLAPP